MLNVIRGGATDPNFTHPLDYFPLLIESRRENRPRASTWLRI